jgi:multiple sugar transport system substrate-binding protein
MSDQHEVTRREFLRLAGLAGSAAMLGACAPAAPATAPTSATSATTVPVAAPTTAPAVAAKKYDGVTLRGLGQGGTAYGPALKKFAEEYAATTGAKVEFDDQPWEQLSPKLQAELAAGQPTYDFFYGDIEFQYFAYPALADLNPLIQKYNYDMTGFFEPVYKYGEGVTGGLAGQRFGLPIRIGACWVFYNTDLVKEFPTTWDAYYKLLAEQTKDGKYGVAFAGVPAQLIKEWLARYWSQGKPLLTEDWVPLINGPEGLKALEMMVEAVDKYAPPGMLGWDNPDASNAFLNGDVAVLEGWASFILPDLQNPEKSKVVDKWSVAQFPESGTGNLTQHNMDVFKASKNVDAAFEYVAYCTGLDTAKRVILEFQEESPRQSVWSDPDVLKEWPFAPDVVKQYAVGKPFTPGLPQWLELFIALAEGLSGTLSKQVQPQEALDTMAKKWTDAINQAKPTFAYKE